MSVILTIDTMAKRYGLLPSEVLSRATTFDMVIIDAALSYENWITKSRDPKYVPEVDQETLQKIKERA